MKKALSMVALATLLCPGAISALPLRQTGTQESHRRDADADESTWRLIDRIQDGSDPTRNDPRPSRSSRFSLDSDRLRATLARAPLEGVSGGLPIELPLPDGSLRQFLVLESPIMEPDLAAAHPETRTYTASAAGDGTTTARLCWTPSGGFQALVITPDEMIRIRRSKDRPDTYVSRATAGLVTRSGTPQCLTAAASPSDETVTEADVESKTAGGPDRSRRGDELFTYRIAISACGEFSQLYGGRNAAIDAITSTLSEINMIFERELCIRLILVANNDRLVFADPATDPFLDDENWNDANQTLTDLLIGTENYDVGMILGTFDGGSSGVGTVCGADKAATTAGSGALWDEGDMLVYTTTHELGHAFGATHSYSSTTAQCNERDPESAYEPGAGHTIMSYYAAWCGPDTAGTYFMPNFHAISFDQIVRFTSSSAACGRRTSTGNSAPVINAGPDHVVPRETPFILTAATSDADGDMVTTSWEQFDRGTTPATEPILRSRPPASGPSRTFPAMSTLLSERPDRNERLSRVDRDLNFRCTARDNSTRGGGVNSDDMVVRVQGAPFRVTVPSAWGILWRPGERQTVRWDVGSSTAPTVRILLSTRLNVWTTLASGVPNTGSHSITVPEANSGRCRIQVQAEDTIYFDVSDHDFAISACGQPGAPIAPGTYSGSLSTSDCRHPSYPSRFVDRYSFQAIAGAMYSVDLNSFDLDPMIGIVDATGTRLFQTAAASGEHMAIVDLIAARSGTHYIEVSSGRDSQLGAYQLTFTGLRNLLLDGGLEREDPVWVQHPEYTVINDDPWIPAFDDIWKATFDAIKDERITLGQMLELPVDGVERVASFWIRTESPGKKSTASSTLTLSIRGPLGDVTPLWSETAYDSKWYPKEYSLVVVTIPAELAVSGAMIVFDATEKTPSSVRFHVDEIALQ